MAYRRRQGMTRSTTFNDHIHRPHEDDDDDFKGKEDSFSSPLSSPAHHLSSPSFPVSDSMGSVVLHNSGADSYKYGFWGVLATKAKSLLDDGQKPPQRGRGGPNPAAPECGQNNARLRKGLGALASSLNRIGDTIGNAFEEGRLVVENNNNNNNNNNNAEDTIIQETRGLRIRTQGITPAFPNPETQLKASRDVAMATAAKAKLLLRELKTVKAELVFAKERCTQLEEENKQLRENRVKGDNHTDDDMIRLQLEILLAEKTRLAHESSILARENRFLREIVEYHQLTMQDLLYVDELDAAETSVYYTPRTGNDDHHSPCLSSPGDLNECDEAPYEDPPEDIVGEVEANSEPAVHAANRPVLHNSNHI